MNVLVIRPVRADEGRRVRDIRTRALADAPYAFSSALIRGDEPDSYWDSFARDHATSYDRTTLIAEADGEWLATASCALVFEEPGDAGLFSFWVDPAWRGRGVGRTLMDHALRWARDRGARYMRLYVTENNPRAIHVYEAAGFVRTDKKLPFPDDAAVQMVMMRKPLG